MREEHLLRKPPAELGAWPMHLTIWYVYASVSGNFADQSLHGATTPVLFAKHAHVHGRMGTAQHNNI